MKQFRTYSNPWVVTFPILFLFLINIWIFGKNVPVSDGIRYWKTASDILDGFRTTRVLESFLLLNGPLYPLILAFFKLIGFSVKASIFLNAIFLYVGFTYFLKSVNQFLSLKKSIWITYILVLIDPFLFYWGAKLYSEPLAILLVCLLIYLTTQYFLSQSIKLFLQIAIVFSLLALTRVIFAYVLLVFIPVGFLGHLIFKQKVFKTLGKLGAYSLLFCLPYLAFTYGVTGKLFYWSSNGGLLLYWTSSPYKTDMGEWHTMQINHDHFAARYNKFSGLDSLYLRKVNDIIISEINDNHREFNNSLSKSKNIIEYDDALKAKAFENIKNYPSSFITNWILNTGRLLVGIPHAIYHKPPFSPFFTLLNTVKSSFVLFLFLTAIVLFFRNFSVFNYHTIWMLLLLMIYLGGQSILAVQSQRFLLPIYPLIVMFSSISILKNLQFKKEKF